VRQHDWSALTDREQVQAGLDLLVEPGWSPCRVVRRV
jgi:hypothetical protein